MKYDVASLPAFLIYSSTECTNASVVQIWNGVCILMTGTITIGRCTCSRYVRRFCYEDVYILSVIVPTERPHSTFDGNIFHMPDKETSTVQQGKTVFAFRSLKTPATIRISGIRNSSHNPWNEYRTYLAL